MQPGVIVAGRFTLVSEQSHDLDQVHAWLARDERLGRDVTVMFVESSTPRQVRSTMAATSALRHRGIVTTHATGIHKDAHGDVPYQVVSAVTGTTLAHVMDRHIVPVALARAIVGRAASVVADIHQREFVHGFLRPAAVRVLDTGDVVVTGWGLDRDVAVEHRLTHGTTQRDDAVALATIFAQAITGEDLKELDTRALPDGLTATETGIVTAVVRGSGPTRVDEVVAALGFPDAAVALDLAHFEDFALTPAAHAQEQARLEAEAARIAAEAAEVHVDPALAVAGAALVQGLEWSRLAPRASWPAVRAQVQALTGASIREADADSAIAGIDVMATRQASRFNRALLERWTGGLHRRWPQVKPLGAMARWAQHRSHHPTVVNPGPLLIALFLTALVITAYLAMGSLRGPWEPDYPRFNPEPQTYPPFTHEPVPTALPSPSPGLDE